MKRSITWAGLALLASGCQWVVGVKDLQETRDAGPAPDAIPAAWTVRRSVPAVIDLEYANGLFVGVGTAGSVLTSPDGVNWTTRTPVTTAELRALTYGNGKWLAAGEGNQVLTSSDAVSWTRTFLGGGFGFFNALAFGKGVFVGVTFDSIDVSTDGLRWTSGGVSGQGINRIAFANSQFVAVGGDGRILQSADGMSWSQRPYSRTTDFFRDVGYSGSTWLGLANTGFATSSDGLTWTPGTTFTNCCYNGLVYSQTNWFVVGNQGQMFRTPDGTALTPISRVTFDDLWHIALGGGTFVAAGTEILRSSDGPTWNNVRPESGAVLKAVAAGAVTGGNAYVAVGDLGHIYVSTDNAVTWRAATVPSGFNGHGINDVAFGGGVFLAADANAPQVAASTDGVTWTARAVPENPWSIVYAGGQWVYGGWSGTIYTSPDGTTFTMRAKPLTELHRLVYGNATYVAAGVDNELSTSPDAVNWTARASGFAAGSNIIWAGYHHGLFFILAFPAGGGETVFAKSPDGVVWTQVTRPSGPFNPFAIGWDGQQYILSTWNFPEQFRASTDLATWSILAAPARTAHIVDFYEPALAGGPRLIGVGNGSTIITVP